MRYCRDESFSAAAATAARHDHDSCTTLHARHCQHTRYSRRHCQPTKCSRRQPLAGGAASMGAQHASDVAACPMRCNVSTLWAILRVLHGLSARSANHAPRNKMGDRSGEHAAHSARLPRSTSRQRRVKGTGESENRYISSVARSTAARRWELPPVWGLRSRSRHRHPPPHCHFIFATATQHTTRRHRCCLLTNTASCAPARRRWRRRARDAAGGKDNCRTHHPAQHPGRFSRLRMHVGPLSRRRMRQVLCCLSRASGSWEGGSEWGCIRAMRASPQGPRVSACRMLVRGRCAGAGAGDVRRTRTVFTAGG
ncbi:hypothetical protein FA95DRAFT_1169138 [Auriscalpium vulgare]|uniref:Uncharacterized protein n=1 Tax=Auriscalpium vulgare TaxID=40419 RepID=A0ACB8S8B1_9AGAM|nr:hypothetical protein FA95DRAFT_1169138 [Auriscalpium vulgare]